MNNFGTEQNTTPMIHYSFSVNWFYKCQFIQGRHVFSYTFNIGYHFYRTFYIPTHVEMKRKKWVIILVCGTHMLCTARAAMSFIVCKQTALYGTRVHHCLTYCYNCLLLYFLILFHVIPNLNSTNNKKYYLHSRLFNQL